MLLSHLTAIACVGCDFKKKDMKVRSEKSRYERRGEGQKNKVWPNAFSSFILPRAYIQKNMTYQSHAPLFWVCRKPVMTFGARIIAQDFSEKRA